MFHDSAVIGYNFAQRARSLIRKLTKLFTVQQYRRVGGRNLHLLHLLSKFRVFDATEFKDKVFAPLALAADVHSTQHFTMDYDNAWSLQEVCTEVVGHLVASSEYEHKLNFLGYAGEDSDQPIQVLKRQRNPKMVAVVAPRLEWEFSTVSTCQTVSRRGRHLRRKVSTYWQICLLGQQHHRKLGTSFTQDAGLIRVMTDELRVKELRIGRLHELSVLRVPSNFHQDPQINLETSYPSELDTVLYRRHLPADRRNRG